MICSVQGQGIKKDMEAGMVHIQKAAERVSK